MKLPEIKAVTSKLWLPNNDLPQILKILHTERFDEILFQCTIWQQHSYGIGHKDDFAIIIQGT